jgi:predicted RND superfamily exporter protein
MTILASIYLMDWRMGLIESISLIVFIGLSVDYVVHISHSFTTCPEKQTERKIRFSYSQMTSTILSGALTSCLSAIFLIAC